MFTKDVVDSYHEQCSEAVKSSIGYSYTFESSDYIPLFKLSRKLNGDTIPFLSVETLKGIRAKYNTDIVIGLDYLRPGLAFTGETRKPVNVQRGYLEGLWRLYDARTGEIIDTHSFSDSVTIRWYQGDLAYYDFVQYIVLSGLDKKAFDNGVSYARRIAPYWGVETRKLYYQGHIEMGRALSFAQDNKWRKAEHIWKELSKRSNKKLKASCYFNLAVASEVMGDYDKAFEYLKKSKEIKSTSLINEYRDKLRKRKSDVLKLDYQMRH
jgi:tetratricopeptide (TPR) repeat protein